MHSAEQFMRHDPTFSRTNHWSRRFRVLVKNWESLERSLFGAKKYDPIIHESYYSIVSLHKDCFDGSSPTLRWRKIHHSDPGCLEDAPLVPKLALYCICNNIYSRLCICCLVNMIYPSEVHVVKSICLAFGSNWEMKILGYRPRVDRKQALEEMI